MARTAFDPTFEQQLEIGGEFVREFRETFRGRAGCLMSGERCSSVWTAEPAVVVEGIFGRFEVQGEAPIPVRNGANEVIEARWQ